MLLAFTMLKYSLIFIGKSSSFSRVFSILKLIYNPLFNTIYQMSTIEGFKNIEVYIYISHNRHKLN
jgi:hypothetical protein